jgi:hypothetical protein
MAGFAQCLPIFTIPEQRIIIACMPDEVINLIG